MDFSFSVLDTFPQFPLFEKAAEKYETKTLKNNHHIVGICTKEEEDIKELASIVAEYLIDQKAPVLCPLSLELVEFHQYNAQGEGKIDSSFGSHEDDFGGVSCRVETCIIYTKIKDLKNGELVIENLHTISPQTARTVELVQQLSEDSPNADYHDRQFDPFLGNAFWFERELYFFQDKTKSSNFF